MARAGAVYVGNDAEIAFERRSGITDAKLLRSNVTVDSDRFSFNYADYVLQTGDRVRITRVDKAGLESAPATVQSARPLSAGRGIVEPPSLQRNTRTTGSYKDLILVQGDSSNNTEQYCYVDEIGRVTFYDTLTNAITQRGGPTGRVQLTIGNEWDWEDDYDEATDTFLGEPYQTIRLELRDDGFRPFAKVNDYQLTTNRDTIDATVLGEYFYKQWENGLIGGQGTITAIWDEQILMAAETGTCDDPYVQTKADEIAGYFAKLVTRIEIGAGFKGRFFLRQRDDDRFPDDDRWAVYWEADCVCTSVAIQASPDAMLQARIEFVTTGMFKLSLSDRRSDASLATEEGDLLQTEDGQDLILTE